MAIADYVHSKGLVFSAMEGPYFAKVIQPSRCVPVSYVPPNRKHIGGNLFKLSYNAKIELYITKLRKDADNMFGLSMLGDGATVKRMPLLNITCSGFDEQCAVLDVVDCTTEHMTACEKNVSYIAFLFNQWIEKIDPERKLVDHIIFDGASNIQKGGHATAAKYPHISVLHGAEHVVSLFFSVKSYGVIIEYYGILRSSTVTGGLRRNLGLQIITVYYDMDYGINYELH
jgi:hypothetical protein